MFSLTWSSDSLRQILELEEFNGLLEPELEVAMKEIVASFQSDAQAYMWGNFKNPQGDLEDSLQTDVPTPYMGVIWTDSPYAWRREEGFSGMTDSLGRFYADDPGIHYMSKTLSKNKTWYKNRLETAVQHALMLVAAGGGI